MCVHMLKSYDMLKSCEMYVHAIYCSETFLWGKPLMNWMPFTDILLSLIQLKFINQVCAMQAGAHLVS